MESLLLVGIGIAAAKLDSWQLVVTLIVVAVGVLCVRWILAGPAEYAAAVAHRESLFRDRVYLWREVNEIAGYLKPYEMTRNWTPFDFRRAAERWYKADLVPIEMAGYDFTDYEAMEESQKRRLDMRRLRPPDRRQLLGHWRKFKLWLRSLVTQQPTDHGARYIVGAPNLASLVIRRAVEEGFIVEHPYVVDYEPTPTFGYHLLYSPSLGANAVRVEGPSPEEMAKSARH